MEHAEMVAAVLKLRLKPGGQTLIGLAVRDYVSRAITSPDLCHVFMLRLVRAPKCPTS